MKYKLIQLLILILCVTSLSGQDYNSIYYEIYQGDLQYKQGNYPEALSRYEAASERMSFVPSPTLRKFLRVAKKGKDRPLQKKYESLIQKQKACPAEYAHVGAKIDSLFREDQRVRIKNAKLNRYYWKNIENKSVMNSPKFLKAKEAHKDCHITDSLNIQILLAMFEEHGFLDESKIGYDKYSKVEIILLHFDNDTSNVVLQPIFDKALANGQIRPYIYGHILGRHLHSCKLRPRLYAYGALHSDPKLSEEDIDEIIKLRESIGMYGTELIVSGKRGYWRVRGFNNGQF